VVVQAVSPHLSLFSLSFLSLSFFLRVRAHTQTHTHTHSIVFPPPSPPYTHHSLASRMPCLLFLALHTCMHNDESHLQQAAMEAVDMRAVCPSPPPSSLPLLSLSLSPCTRALSYTHTYTQAWFSESHYPLLSTLSPYMRNDESHLQQAAMGAVDMGVAKRQAAVGRGRGGGHALGGGGLLTAAAIEQQFLSGSSISTSCKGSRMAIYICVYLYYMHIGHTHTHTHIHTHTHTHTHMLAIYIY
jgi:hypothetical protein